MRERHTVRKYTDKALPQEIIEKLNARIDENNSRFGLAVKLIPDSADGLNLFAKLAAKGVKNYFVLAADGGEEAAEKLGYSSSDLMLFAQTLGLNTWYIGGTFNHGVAKYADGKMSSASLRSALAKRTVFRTSQSQRSRLRIMTAKHPIGSKTELKRLCLHRLR